MSDAKTHTAVLAGFDCKVHFSGTRWKEIKITEDSEIIVTVPGDWNMAKVEEAMIKHSEEVKENLEKAIRAKPLALAGIMECTFTVLID